MSWPGKPIWDSSSTPGGPNCNSRHMNIAAKLRYLSYTRQARDSPADACDAWDVSSQSALGFSEAEGHPLAQIASDSCRLRAHEPGGRAALRASDAALTGTTRRAENHTADAPRRAGGWATAAGLARAPKRRWPATVSCRGDDLRRATAAFQILGEIRAAYRQSGTATPAGRCDAGGPAGRFSM